MFLDTPALNSDPCRCIQ